jgi:cyclopropane-fatty-acyl-phospholipid synthase
MTEPASGDAVAHSRRVVAALFGAPAQRQFDVRYWDGTVERGAAVPSPFTLVVARPGALRRMLLPPSELSIVEAYISGDVDVEGDLTKTMTVGDAINTRLRSPSVLASLVRDLMALPKNDGASVDVRQHRADDRVETEGEPHEPARDRAAIQYHYDVGNDFYRLWLDERMVYSCAYFEQPRDTLDDAQEAKLDLVCRKLRLREGERFLDVGCGWGALVMHAARNYGVQAVGITLSEEQRSLASERVADAGLDRRVHVEIRDYRNASALGPFDKVASVGMVEHVGVERLPEYFTSVARVLKPGGLFLNHGIVRVGGAREPGWRERLERRVWRRDAFIEKYVFPDGRLGHYHALVSAAEDAGFETRDVESLREHYALTLKHWVDRLERCRKEAIEIVGDATYRVWRLYMTASMHGFASGRLNVLQTLLAKPDHGRANLPLTRKDLFTPGSESA